ncbi:hypothetical protein CXG81DRAFT_20418 [Caulochytrium protostelioides]|uniref:DUF2062 domain-containing protein n=1 Tax=Caulochytrium protostelioides TaxID=1555241 RepID=A0A4V1IU68_9FUNG|nr:hypothetical protein CXG81DRAFT_20418 [Caulochytrium protostelioides]|eukprot:RKO99508.1 hypothetical protein CXG81DRAFT_20418 [Caulochytrium protostelioides]
MSRRRRRLAAPGLVGQAPTDPRADARRRRGAVGVTSIGMAPSARHRSAWPARRRGPPHRYHAVRHAARNAIRASTRSTHAASRVHRASPHPSRAQTAHPRAASRERRFAVRHRRHALPNRLLRVRRSAATTTTTTTTTTITTTGPRRPVQRRSDVVLARSRDCAAAIPITTVTSRRSPTRSDLPPPPSLLSSSSSSSSSSPRGVAHPLDGRGRAMADGRAASAGRGRPDRSASQSRLADDTSPYASLNTSAAALPLVPDAHDPEHDAAWPLNGAADPTHAPPSASRWAGTPGAMPVGRTASPRRPASGALSLRLAEQGQGQGQGRAAASVPEDAAAMTAPRPPVTPLRARHRRSRGGYRAAAVRAWLYAKIVQPLIDALKQGLSPDKLALSLACGVAAGLYPVPGLTAVVAFILALGFGLNVPVVQAVNFSLTAAELALAIPTLRFGERLLGLDPLPLTPGELWDQLRSQFVATLGQALRAVAAATFGWAVIAVPATYLLYQLLRPVTRWGIARYHAARGRPAHRGGRHGDAVDGDGTALGAQAIGLGGVPDPDSARHRAEFVRLDEDNDPIFDDDNFAADDADDDAARYLPQDAPRSAASPRLQGLHRSSGAGAGNPFLDAAPAPDAASPAVSAARVSSDGFTGVAIAAGTGAGRGPVAVTVGVPRGAPGTPGATTRKPPSAAPQRLGPDDEAGELALERW